MPTKAKEKKVENFVELLQNAKIAFVAEYHGLTVEQVSQLRRDLREKGSEMKIIKNTLAKHALNKVGYNDLADQLVGPLAFFLGYETAVEAPKVVFDFAKENNNLKIKSGYYSGKPADFSLLKELADLPPLDQLRIRFTHMLSSPTKQFFTTVQAPLKQFVFTLDALKKKLEESESEN
jgi:large subunit ribosomal protein L10